MCTSKCGAMLRTMMLSGPPIVNHNILIGPISHFAHFGLGHRAQDRTGSVCQTSVMLMHESS